MSNPAVGNVTPSSITTSLTVGQSYRQSVSLTLPSGGALTNMVDVFLLFDDTGSFVNNSPIVRDAFPTIISQLQTALPASILASASDALRNMPTTLGSIRLVVHSCSINRSSPRARRDT